MAMKKLSLLAFAALSVTATAASAQSVESGYARGTLAVAAIERGDLARAEALLTDPRLNANDPARLVNLGQVYWATGRQSEALVAWRRALDSRHHFLVETLGGRELSTAQLAREALATHSITLTSAAR
jgi:hypothetical protein